MPQDITRVPAELVAQADGREAELSLLEREHDEARSTRRARVVFLRGKSGVGRTHLLGAFRRTLASRGAAVFEAGRTRDGRRPWALFAPMVPELLSHLSQLGVPDQKVAALARGVSPLAEREAAAPRVKLFDDAVELFSIAGREGAAFLFDDVDAADQSSLELLRYLLGVQATPVADGGGLYVVSFRDDRPLPLALGELVARVSGRTLSLSGLDVDGIRAFLARREVAERLLQVTMGSPEALQGLLERQPPPALDFVARRLERLSAEQRALLELLASAGEALALDVLSDAAARVLPPGLDVPGAIDALVSERAVAARVTKGRAAFTVARELGADAVLKGTDARRRAQLSLALGRALEAQGDLTGAAPHLLFAAPQDGAATAVAAAAQLAGRGAHAEAAELLARAVPELTGEAKAGALDALAHSHASLGSWKAAARACLAASREGAAADAARRSLEASRHLLKLGRKALARAALAPALAAKATRAAAVAVQADLALSSGDAQAAVRACDEALVDSGLPAEAAASLKAVLGRALLVRGEAARAKSVFEALAADAEARGAPDQAALARLNLGVAAHKLGDREGALELYAQTPKGHRPAHAQALANAGSLHAEAGEFELALDHLARALKTFTRCEGKREVAHVASNLARVHLLLGETARAVELSEHAQARAAELGDPYLEAQALLNLGAAAAESGDEPLAIARLEEARERFERLGNDGFAALAAALKAHAHLKRGEKARAEAELSRRSVERGAPQLFAATLEVELARGELALLLSDLHEAGRAVARVREALLSQPDLEGPWRAHLLAGKLKAQGGDAAGAQAEFSRAARLLDALAQRVPAPLRQGFLSSPRRAELLKLAEPELKLPPVATASAAPAHHGLVGGSGALLDISKKLPPIGKSNATVLLRGESGTGKEVIAEALHRLSPRRDMPLVKVNCAAMVEELLLSELFGHEKGAFTGAVRERKGRFELADGGTLFLDEIGDISPRCQVALLRVLQEREFERVGGTRTLKVDVRVICATNRDLEALIAQGRFRADLYYRLKGVMLELPPLRARLEDLPVLATHFLARSARERGEQPKRLSDEALALLERHTWPGNVRELENVLAAAAIFAEGPLVTPDAFSHVQELDLLMRDGAGPAPAAAPRPVALSAAVETPAPAPSPAQPAALVSLDGPLDYYQLAKARGISLKELRHEVEMQCIRRALVESQGNISEAARLLLMKRSRLSQIVNANPELKEVARGDL